VIQAETSPAPRMILLVTTAGLAWFWMQGIHELGHALAGWLSGAEVRQVVLHPLTISRTDLGLNPKPLLVCWAGPLMGVTAPLIVWAVSARLRLTCAYWLRFFAGFCLIANGAYLAVGARDGIGDAGDLVVHGAPVWTLYLFGLVTIPAGFALWNGLGAQFGLGGDGRSITWQAALTCTTLLGITVILELILSHT